MTEKIEKRINDKLAEMLSDGIITLDDSKSFRIAWDEENTYPINHSLNPKINQAVQEILRSEGLRD